MPERETQLKLQEVLGQIKHFAYERGQEADPELREIDTVCLYFLQAQALSLYALDEVERFHAGETIQISSSRDLRRMFGMRRDRLFREVITADGIGQERKAIFEQLKQEAEEKGPAIFPSNEWAWMIGVLAMGGNNNPRNGQITVTEENKDFLQVVKSAGGRLFGSEGHEYQHRINEDGSVYKGIRFHNRNISDQLGDLRRDRWFQTIQDKHQWILTDDKFIVSFLGGVFDARGRIDSGQISLSTSYPEIANFLSELLVRLGIENPIAVHKDKVGEKLTRVAIVRRTDIKIFVDSIHSRIPQKEAGLEVLRNQEIVRQKDRSLKDEDVVAEWLYLRNILGHNPSAYEISKFHQKNQTVYSVPVYSRRFGDGSFAKATQEIKRIALENGWIHEEQEIAPRVESKKNKNLKIPKKRAVIVKKPIIESREDRSARRRQVMISEYEKARDICLREKGRLPTHADMAELRSQKVISYSPDSLALYFGEGSFVLARQQLESAISEKQGIQPETPLPRISVYARRPKQGDSEIYDPRQKMIEEYRKAREMSLAEKGVLPTIHYIGRLRGQRFVTYSAHSIANYFGDRSFKQAIVNLEEIIANQSN